jgi:beta-xylosidase
MTRNRPALLFRIIGSTTFALLASTLLPPLRAQSRGTAAPTYSNPILFADYSDPDVLRVGDDFYMISSTFEFVPGIPILHSRDLVHWEIIGHVVSRLTMNPAYEMKGGTRYGGGIWAPSVRFHSGLFYVYFPTPDEGIFVATAPSMTGPWTAPEVVLAGPGLEDPCPFWDDDGNAYLVHSRKGAGPLILHRMSADGKHLLDAGRVIVDDPVHLPTLEGPKFYKRDGWYYIFAPMGGVSTGDQVVLRAKNIYGPYEARHVLTQGSTQVNGPHQGGWVDAPDGRAWFLHFQQRGAHGRIVWLEPMRWQNDWPLMGTTALNTTSTQGSVGEPVLSAPLPVIVPGAEHLRPQTSDEFNRPTLSPLWEWNHDPDNARWSLTARPGYLRLQPTAAPDLYHARNTLTETMQDQSLEVTTRMDTTYMVDGDRAGLSAFDRSLSGIGLRQNHGSKSFFFSARGQNQEGPTLPSGVNSVYFRLRVNVDQATYFFSVDGKHFDPLGSPVQLVFSWWKGARPALFAYNPLTESKGYADFDWVHYIALPSVNPAR